MGGLSESTSGLHFIHLSLPVIKLFFIILFHIWHKLKMFIINHPPAIGLQQFSETKCNLQQFERKQKISKKQP